MCFSSKGFAFSPFLGSALVGLPELCGLLLRHRLCSLSASPLGCGRGFRWTCRSSGSFGVARASWTRHPSIHIPVCTRGRICSGSQGAALRSPFFLPLQAQASAWEVTWSGLKWDQPLC